MVAEHPHLETPIRDYQKYMIAGRYSKATISKEKYYLIKFSIISKRTK